MSTESSNDLPARLRNQCDYYARDLPGSVISDMHDAADEMERLYAETRCLQALADNRGGAVRWLLTCLERSSRAWSRERQYREQAIAFAWSTLDLTE